MEWLVPWHPVTDDPGQVAAMKQELQRELAPAHPPFGLPMRTLGRRQASDDVLFAVEDGTGQVAVVHLTWTHSPPELPPYPQTVLYSNLAAWAADGMRPDAEEHHA
jgi:hypothetical protein